MVGFEDQRPQAVTQLNNRLFPGRFGIARKQQSEIALVQPQRD